MGQIPWSFSYTIEFLSHFLPQRNTTIIIVYNAQTPSDPLKLLLKIAKKLYPFRLIRHHVLMTSPPAILFAFYNYFFLC